MTARRIALLLLVAACLTGGWFAWRLELQLIRLRGEAAASRTTAVGKQLADAERDETELAKELAQLQSAARSSEAGSPKPDKPAVDPQTRHRALVSFAKAWMEQNGAQAYRRLAQSLKLSDAQIAQLRELSAERLVAAFEAVRPFTRTNDGPPDSSAMQQAAAAAAADMNGQIQQLLGDSGYADYQQQLQLAPAEAFVDRLNQGLAGLPEQLSEDQKDQLAQILAKAQPAANGQNGMMGILNGLSGNGNFQLTDSGVAQAAAVLSPDQVAALRQYQADIQARNTIFRIRGETMRTLQQAQGGPDAAK